MSDQNQDPLTETPEEESLSTSSPTEIGPAETGESSNAFARFWSRVQEMGITNTVVRVGSSVLTVALVVVAVYALGRFYLNRTGPSEASEDAAQPAITEQASDGQSNIADIVLPEYTMPDTAFFYGSNGIEREAEPETVIPSRSRAEVTYYEVQQGDSVFSIAEKFGLEPQTILWGNYDTLNDNPRFLAIGQVLNILPTDGIYYRYSAGESLTNIARSFDVNADDIIQYPGNDLDPYETNPEGGR